MNTAEEKISRFSPQPFEGLESPFLDEEVYAGAKDEEWEGALAALEAETPFAQGLIHGAGTWNAEELLAEFEAPDTGEEIQDFEEDESEDFAWEAESPYAELEAGAFEEEILGKDERVLVSDTLQIPNRWICAIDIWIDNPKWGSHGEDRLICRSRATGILIGPRYVLTARHVMDKQTIQVDGKSKFVDVKELTVSPARNGNNANNPFGKVKAKDVKQSIPYMLRRKVTQGGKVIEIPIRQHDDYALIILEKDLDASTHSKMKGRLGYWGQDQSVAVVRRAEPSAIQGKDVAVIGYPGDTCGKDRFSGSQSQKQNKIENCWNRRKDEWASTQWRGVGKLEVDAAITTAYHTVDTYKGQSGAPICITLDKRLNLVAVHTHEHSPTKNKGVRVTRRTLTELCEWMNADAGITIATIKDDTLIVQPKSSAGASSKEYLDEFEEDEVITGEFVDLSDYTGAQEPETEAYDEDEALDVEGEIEDDKVLARMKFEFQTKNRIWRNDGKAASLLDRKYGPDDFLVDNKGVRLESETHGVLEFETEWFRAWPKLEKSIEKAVKTTDDMNAAGPSKFDKSRKAFPFNIDHLRKGTAREIAQGFWDRRQGKEGEKEKILGSKEELEVEIIDDKWEAGIQSSESLLLDYYESFLRQHEWPHYRDGAIKHARAILDAANTSGAPLTELVKLRSFLLIIVNYIMRGQGGKESEAAGAFSDVKGLPAKQAFTLMSRTSFASIYRTLLTDSEKAMFQIIVKNGAILTALGLNKQSPVFIKGYGSKAHHPGPTIHAWLSGILNGVDQLSARSGNGLSAAMGRYDVETRKGKKDSWLVKFETRNTKMGAFVEAKGWVKYASDLFDLASKRERHALGLVIQQGIKDENKLTNFVFFARHPELKGRKIRKSERDLAQKWLRIRDEFVRPALQGVQPELEEFEGAENRYQQWNPSDLEREAYADDIEAGEDFEGDVEGYPSMESEAEFEQERVESVPGVDLTDELEGLEQAEFGGLEEAEEPLASAATYSTKLDEALLNFRPRKFDPPVASNGFYDSNYWIIKDDPAKWRDNKKRRMLVLKPGKKPSKAIQEIVNQSATKWSMDCAYFVQVVHLYALSQADTVQFDRQFEDKEFWLRYHRSSGARHKYFFRREDKNAPWKAYYAGKWNAVSSKWNNSTVLAAMPRGSRVMWCNELGSGALINENTIKVGDDRYRAFGFDTHKVLSGRQVALLLAAVARGDEKTPIIESSANASAALKAYTDTHIYLKEAASFR